ncbi:BTAD domain-containing putative transcriptional regulator [Dactylosporangium siamense]|uniref:SARP family transcriptional regulator n=1 Tax=Dactylosporangium siamense TaxID=685454 RepID=A0A919PTZ2_9ACTN|nr:BTAD domain-containing putative transcriptional regulator [Dactylosporangium siamense]GIG50790.1 SARP family transcriptional regulator [Dactylosporangium siamense]
MSHFQFRILGPVEIRRDGATVALGPPKQRMLLLVLLLHANQVLSLDRITDLLWQEDPPLSAQANVRTYCVRLRRVLADPDHAGGTRLVTRRPGFLVEVRDGELDLHTFDREFGAGRMLQQQGAVDAAAERLSAALAHWRGPAAAGVRRDAALSGLLDTLDEQRGDAVEALAAARLAQGRHAEVVAELRREVVTHPLRERLWELLMIAQYRSGDAAGALSTFQRARAVLAERIGIEPAAELTRLHGAILNRDETLLAATPTAAGPVLVPPRELPLDNPAFVERTAELDAMRATLQTPGGPAVVVVHGPGGIGKSTFAVRAAHQVSARFPDGQLYADLHGAAAMPPAEPAAVLGRFLRALGVPEVQVPSDPEEAAGRFRSLTAARRLLVVLDNAADEAQVRPLLPAGPGCAAIVTSRRMLVTLESSHSMALGALSTRGALALLGRLCGTERVATAGARAVELVRQCEHLPLAVRIAAARLAGRPDRPLAALADELREERHRLNGLRAGELAVRTCFQVSYQGLGDPTAARLFRLLALVRTPTFEPAVAAALLDVCTAEAEPALDRLAEAHLLSRTGGDRFAMHDLLRCFAAELADAMESTVDRRAAVARALSFYLGTVQQAVDVLRPNQRREEVPQLEGAPARVAVTTPAEALHWLDSEWPCLLAVARHVADGEPEHARFVLGLSTATIQYLPMRGRWDDIATLGTLSRRVAAALGDWRAESTARTMLAIVCRERGEYAAALDHLHDVLAARRAAQDERGIAATLSHLGLTHARRGDPAAALRCFEESAARYGSAGRRPAVGITRYEAGEVLLQLGDYERALGYLLESLQIRRAERDLVGEGITLTGLGKAYVRLGRPAQGAHLLTLGLRRCQETGAQDSAWQALLWRAEAYRRLDRLDAAVADLTAALAVCRDAGLRVGEAYVLRLLASVWHDCGQDQRAEACRRRAAVVPDRAPRPAGPVAPDDDWPPVRTGAPAREPRRAAPAQRTQPAQPPEPVARASGPGGQPAG